MNFKEKAEEIVRGHAGYPKNYPESSWDGYHRTLCREIEQALTETWNEALEKAAITALDRRVGDMYQITDQTSEMIARDIRSLKIDGKEKGE